MADVEAPAREDLVLTPARLRLDSRVVAAYTTGTWLMHAAFLVLLALKINGQLADLTWWAVMAPEWAVHAVQVPLFLAVIAGRSQLVLQQLGPPPGPLASAGLVLQYSSMRHTRRRTLLVDSVCSMLESAALLAVKVMLAQQLESGAVAAGTVCWRAVFMPLWVLWPLTTVASWFKASSERMLGSISDLVCLTAVFVALKLDGVVLYSWKVVFLVPWMWFGAIFLAALAALGFTVAAYTCVRVRELAMPLGTLALLLSASVQLPAFIYLARLLDGDDSVAPLYVVLPMAASWAAMWASALVVCVGLRWKERLRAELAAAGRTWTADDATHRSVMQADVRETQRRVDAMSDAQLARLTRKLMKHKERPKELLRVGETLWRPAVDGASAAAGVQSALLSDGVASVPASPPPLQLARIRDSGTQEEVCLASNGGALPGSLSCCDPDSAQLPAVLDPEEAGATVTVEIRVRSGTPAGAPRSPLPLRSLEGGKSPELVGAGGGRGPWPLEDAAVAVGPPGGAAADAKPQLAPHPLQLPAELPVQQPQQPVAGQPSPRVQSRGPTPALPRPPASSMGGADDGLCTICCDRPATCVFLQCGHGGYCWRCAHVLYVRPPNECPVCRARIDLVLELSDPAAPQGARVPVIPQEQPQAHAGLLGCLCAGSGDGSSGGGGGTGSAQVLPINGPAPNGGGGAH